MKILLLGKNGQVGWELNRTLLPLGEIVALDVEDLDLTRQKDIREKVRYIHPDIIINGAAYTAVDKAEEEQELAMAVNGVAPGVLAEEAKRCGAFLVHYSTDYVFDGTKDEPYKEDDKPHPINFYGKSKLAGEQAIQEVDNPYFIFRTSWVYGLRGKNFLLTMMRLAKEKDKIQVVNDQIGSPTWSRLIAEITAQTICSLSKNNLINIGQLSGIYHLTCSGNTSWYHFTEQIIQGCTQIGEKFPRIIPVTSDEYPTKAKRPPKSILDCSLLEKKFFFKLPPWEKTLKMVLSEKIGGDFGGIYYL